MARSSVLLPQPDAPNTAMIGKPEMAQGFMAAPEPRAKRDAHKEIQAFAAKYAPARKPKGTVTQ